MNNLAKEILKFANKGKKQERAPESSAYRDAVKSLLGAIKEDNIEKVCEYLADASVLSSKYTKEENQEEESEG